MATPGAGRSTEPGSQDEGKNAKSSLDRLDPEVLFVPGSRLPHIKVPWAEERRARAGEGGAGLRMPPAGLQSQLSCHWLGDPTTLSHSHGDTDISSGQLRDKGWWT